MPQKYKWGMAAKISDDLATQLLYNRGVVKTKKPRKEAIRSFLYPNPKNDLHNPFLMLNLKKAVYRIMLSVNKKEKVGIFADYDADGIPGAALLYEAFRKLNLETFVYIPDRSEGYGFSCKGVDYFKDKEVNLIVTVDCGIRDTKAVFYAREQGFDVIICDHHEQGKILPRAYAVIDPKQKKEKYPFRDLSGAAVAFKLIQGLSKLTPKINNRFLKNSLDLVAISVISDIVPLLDENRVFAKIGLLVLRKTERLGLIELYKTAGINSAQLKAYHIGFMIGPRINAPGRMYSPQTSFELLITKNKKEAKEYAQILNEVNKERQRETDRFIKKAQKKIKKDKLDKLKIILISGDEWPQGLTGLIASKLKDQFNRPVFIFSKGKKEAKGSARSIDGFHLAEVLLESQKLIKKGGGHAKAAGIQIKNEKLKEFYDHLLQLAEQKISKKDLMPKIEIDAQIELTNINWQNYKLIDSLEPYGLANPRPKFLAKNLEIIQVKTMGNGEKHLSLILASGSQSIRAVYFSGGEIFSKIKRGDLIDAVFSIEVNDFSGQPKLELHLEDVRLANN